PRLTLLLIVLQIAYHTRIGQQALDPPGLVEALVGGEFQLRREFEAEPLRHLALEIGGVAAQGREHLLLVPAQQRLHIDARLPQIRRHAHFSDGHRMRAQRFVMHLPPREDFAEHMAHPLPHRQLTDGAVFLSRGLACHRSLSTDGSSRGRADHSVRSCSVTSNTSRWSPALMSLVSASTTPHSRPARTSSTSSLKRRSEAMVVAETMTSLRVSRACRPLRIAPSTTSRPAALSFLPAGNTCLTSARPMTFSTRSGPSSPAISFAISSVR